MSLQRQWRLQAGEGGRFLDEASAELGQVQSETAGGTLSLDSSGVFARAGTAAMAVARDADGGRGELVAEGASKVKFAGMTTERGELLRSPVSGTACVHWRLRIVEQVNGTLQLVHEIASPDEFDVTWSGTGQRAGGSPNPHRGSQIGDGRGEPLKFRVVPHTARIEATPVLHRPGSPGALATARQFGFMGQLSVEEVILRAGEEIVAEGFLEETSVTSTGPFRGVQRELELFDATVRLPARAALAPVLLPWALGTAAALLGGVGVAAWAARRFDLLPELHHGTVTPTAEIGPLIYTRRHYSRPE